METSRSDYTQEDSGRSWSSQEWKSGVAEHDLSGKFDCISLDEEPFLGRNAQVLRASCALFNVLRELVLVHRQEQAYFENFVMGSDATEFVNKVRDQVRIRQKRMSSIAESGDEHSIIWGMFMATTLNAATFVGKNFSTIQSVVKKHESLILTQMFDVTTQFVNNSVWEEILDTCVMN